MFIIVAVLSPSFHAASGITNFIILLLLILSGCVVVRFYIPGWWIWCFWINPFRRGSCTLLHILLMQTCHVRGAHHSTLASLLAVLQLGAACSHDKYILATSMAGYDRTRRPICRDACWHRECRTCTLTSKSENLRSSAAGNCRWSFGEWACFQHGSGFGLA